MSRDDNPPRRTCPFGGVTRPVEEVPAFHTRNGSLLGRDAVPVRCPAGGVGGVREAADGAGRRGLLLGLAGLGAGGSFASPLGGSPALAQSASGQAVPDQPIPPAAGEAAGAPLMQAPPGRDAVAAHRTIPFEGPHQAGILDPPPASGMVAAFDVLAPDRAGLEALFRTLTARIRFLMGGGTPPAEDPRFPPADSGILGAQVVPDGLTVTVAVGASLFDERYGLTEQRPRRLTTMTRFPNDALDRNWCHGDLLLQICANTPQAVLHALRDVVKNTPATLRLRWMQDGFLPQATPPAAPLLAATEHAAAGGAGSPGSRTIAAAGTGRVPGAISGDVPGATPGTAAGTADRASEGRGISGPARETPHNLLGFRDGTANPDPTDREAMTRLVWVGQGGDEPAWAAGGTYQVVRLIRNFVERWDRTPLGEQETIIGRHKDTGAPMGETEEYALPRYDDDPDGQRTRLDAHIRLANPRDAATANSLILRRPFNYARGVTRAGQLDMGLLFICFQRDLEAGFIAVQRRLDGEPLEEYIKPTGGGYFFALPGVDGPVGFLAQSLLAT